MYIQECVPESFSPKNKSTRSLFSANVQIKRINTKTWKATFHVFIFATRRSRRTIIYFRSGTTVIRWNKTPQFFRNTYIVFSNLPPVKSGFVTVDSRGRRDVLFGVEKGILGLKCYIRRTNLWLVLIIHDRGFQFWIIDGGIN